MGFCYQENFAHPTQPVDEARFWALVRARQWNENIDLFRQTGDQSLKRKLPAFIFQATFDETTSLRGTVGRWRKQAATELTGLVVMDIDHVDAHPLPLPKGGAIEMPTPQDYYNVWRKTHPELFGNQTSLPLGGVGGRLLLVYITPSGHGLKIVFKARKEWGNLIDNQHRMAELLGVEVDESCKDASRMSFICKEEDILFINNELFTYENKEFAERYNDEYRAGHSAATAAKVEVEKTNEITDSKLSTLHSPLLWRGIEVQKIIDARYGDKLPCAADSNRHNESLRLASDLLILFDGDKAKTLATLKAQTWVQEIISERNENVEQTVQSAAERMAEKEKKYLSQQPSKAMQEAISTITGSTCKEITSEVTKNEVASTIVSTSDIDRWLWDWGERIEALFPKFPLLSDVCKGLKRNQYPAAMFVGGGLLMTLMTRCTYRFYHRPEELRRLNNSTLIIGDPASGKSFATRLYKLLAAPIIRADQPGRDAVNAFREQTRTKGANKDKPQRPKVIIRVHPARTSNAQFITDMVNSVEEVDGQKMQLHMLTFDTELDNTMTVQKGGAWIDKQSMELKAFHNEEDGQAYSNTDSVLQDFVVTWNYIYTGTPNALKKKVSAQTFGTGLPTRLSCIPLPPTNFEMMTRETTVDYDSDRRLSEWAEKLDRTKGELSVQKIVDELYDWTARRMADAKDNSSKADEMLLKRCAYHGLNFAAPFIVMRHWDQMHQDGSFWCGEFETDDVDWKLAELICNIQYACQRYFFGKMAEKYFEDKDKEVVSNVQARKPTIEAFDRLPEEFTSEDVMRCFNLKTMQNARIRISRLKKDDLIEKFEEFVENGTTKAKYRKTGQRMQ